MNSETEYSDSSEFSIVVKMPGLFWHNLASHVAKACHAGNHALKPHAFFSSFVGQSRDRRALRRVGERKPRRPRTSLVGRKSTRRREVLAGGRCARSEEEDTRSPRGDERQRFSPISANITNLQIRS